MTHEDAPHYRIKHPAGTPCDPDITAALTRRVGEGRITCAAAFAAATQAQAEPAEVGKVADLQEYRIVACQLGLFGYSPEKRIVRAAEQVPDDLRDRILTSADEGRITCASCFMLAEDLGMEKMAVSAACERLRLKIIRCQLGAF